MELQKVAFLDRDGVLVEYREFLSNIEDFHILPDSMKALRLLKDHGYLVFVLTNQPMVGRGTLRLEDLEDMHDHLRQAALMAGGKIESIQFCPHTPPPGKPGYLPEFVVDCDCRKPKIGMFHQACRIAKERGIDVDIKNSWMVGDSWRDIGLGKGAGLNTGAIRGTPELIHPELKGAPDVVGNSLLEVVQQILKI